MADRILTNSVNDVPGYLGMRQHSIFHPAHLDADGEAFRWANCVPGDGFLRVPERPLPDVPSSVERLFAVARAEGSGLVVFSDDPRAAAGRPELPTYGPVATHKTIRHPSRDPRREN